MLLKIDGGFKSITLRQLQKADLQLKWNWYCLEKNIILKSKINDYYIFSSTIQTIFSMIFYIPFDIALISTPCESSLPPPHSTCSFSSHLVPYITTKSTSPTRSRPRFFTGLHLSPLRQHHFICFRSLHVYKVGE